MKHRGAPMDKEDALRLKLRLLLEGAVLGDEYSKGRSGGAGPVGGRYFLLPNGKPCGIPIREGKVAERFQSARLEPTDNPGIWMYDGNIELEVIPAAKFQDRTTADGIPFRKLALLHGQDCLATTVYQNCRYWSEGSQCKFCTIPSSYKSGATPLEKNPSQLAEVTKAAEEDGLVDNILLTTGTTDSPDLGSSRLAQVVKGIREVSELPIAVQFEPPEDLGFIDQIYEAGARAIGIHIESMDDDIRKEMCPGKHTYGSQEMYWRAWKHAVGLFGKGNVSTFILHGFGEDLGETLEAVEKIAEIGVMPIVAPIRPAPGSQLVDYTPTYVGHLEESLEFYKGIGRVLCESNLNPSMAVGSCSKCGGCTPIQEAYDWAEAL